MPNQILHKKFKLFITTIIHLFVIIITLPVIVNAQEEAYRDKIPKNIPEDVKKGIELLVSNNSSSVLATAAFEIGKLGPKAIAAESYLINLLPNSTSLVWSPPGLEGIGGEPTTLGVEAAKALWNINGNDGLELLTQLFEEGNFEIKANIAQALGKIEDHNALKFLIAKLEDGSPKIRKIAAEGLFWGQSPLALDPLIAALNDEYEEVRRNAIKSLMWYNDTRMVEPLIQALKDPDFVIQAKAIEILGRLKDRRSIQPLIIAMVEERDFYNEIPKTLNKISPNWRKSEAAKSIVPQLLVSLRSSNDIIRKNAIIWLGNLEDKRAVNALITALNDNFPDPPSSFPSFGNKIRENAIISLGKIKDTRAFEPLIKIIQNKNRNIRERALAALALGNFKDQRAVVPLIEALKEKEWGYLVMSAVEALGEIGDPRARAPLQATPEELSHYDHYDSADKRKIQKSLQKLKK